MFGYLLKTTVSQNHGVQKQLLLAFVVFHRDFVFTVVSKHAPNRMGSSNGVLCTQFPIMFRKNSSLPIKPIDPQNCGLLVIFQC